ncbi:nucleotide-diphospho-sugar transferase [Dendryphion nanum]|uniref:Translation initiation factor eIF2B subunit gamma n=1 Tax=Dendryphion nanum TaxID=256645 RepID=A0A9P9CZD2_9PLEO|nr:nucleotide-diphospho-sugar transferase [Dendryphion nanum]
MPHATLPPPGFQAVILCGPGASFTTFTSTPQDIPKALLPIANRPMVWYPLDWCYRMGITDITVITPPESLDAIKTAMSQNPHLTSLPNPKPDLIAPADLHHDSGTGELFRLPEVRDAIKGDFLVLPCDIVCELDGTSLIDAWLVEEAGLGGASGGFTDAGLQTLDVGGENIGRRGGLGVWYQTKGEGSKKGAETDFIATTPLPNGIVPPQTESLRRNISNVVYAAPTDTLKDITEDNKGLPIRHSLLRHHARVRMLTTHRDAHIYLFPYWIMDMLQRNDRFESVSEDVLGWWAKAGWQEGLGDKLGLRDIFFGEQASDSDGEGKLENSQFVEEAIDVSKLSTTWVNCDNHNNHPKTTPLASRVQNSNIPEAAKSITPRQKLNVPPLLAYIQPSDPSQPLIRRVDTAALLLSVSLRLAKIPSLEESGTTKDDASPFAHPSKIAHSSLIPRRSRVEPETCLVAENVIVEEKTNVKECVIGPNCKIGEGARLLRCLLMDAVEIGPNVQLTDCILGRRCKIEGGDYKSEERTHLRDCEVQDGQVVEWGTEIKGERIMRFDMGSEEGGDGFGDAGGFEDDEGGFV